jgi:hypothetical protein
MASSPVSPFGSSSPFSPETNPFMNPAREVEAREGYAMIPAGPALDASEVETSELATEVVVRWEETILHVGHLAQGKSFIAGEAADCDLMIPSERLGTDRLPVVVTEGSATLAVLPSGADVSIKIGDRKIDLATAAAEGLATSSAHAPRAMAVALAHGTRITIKTSGFVFEVASVFAGRRVAGKGRGDKKSFAAQALSFGLHGAILATMFAFMPALAATDEAELSDDQAHLLAATLKAQAEKDMKEQEELQKAEDGAKENGGTGQASPGESGKIGASTAAPANKHYAVAGNEKERALSRQAALEDAANFGFAGMLASLQKDDPNAPSSPWSNGAIGMDSVSANGNMWGALPGDAYGTGLGLSGTGLGAGGLGTGVGLGFIDTAGHGSGTCAGSHCQGFGNSGGIIGGGHTPRAAKLRVTDTKVSGRIPPEVIQRVVRQNFGRFRACYEAGLRNNPSLQGRVAVAFTVGRDGSVGSAQSAGSDLPDSNVVSCVVKQFYGLSFPAPEDGIVRVSYPIMFSN